MSQTINKYCLDSNVLIQAWQKYYSPNYCQSYWDVLNDLGNQGIIFIPEMVYEEITRTDDDLSEWLKSSMIEVKTIDVEVTKCLKNIYSADSNHKHMVDDSKKGRSLADPWVIAHAMKEQAIVVTKEEKITAINSNKIKIPNVCDKMNVRWINDFEFVAELNIQFMCTR